MIANFSASELDEINKKMLEEEETTTSQSSMSECESSLKEEQLPLDDLYYFKLGQGNSFQVYKNQYSHNALAKSKADILYEKERKRYISNKFSLVEFRWIGSCYMGELSQVSTLQNTLVNFESLLPIAFLHPNWHNERKTWIQAVKLCTEVNHFSSILMYLEEVIKPIIMVSSWKDTCGALKWDRIQGELKPQKQNKSKRSQQQTERIEVVSDDEPDEPIGKRDFLI